MVKGTITGAWEDALAFLRQQHSLVLPIALAFFSLPTLVLSWIMPIADPADPAPSPQAGAWMLWLVPFLAALMVGNITLCALALRRDASVREAVEAGVRRLGTGAQLVGLFVLAIMAFLILGGMVGALLAMASIGQKQVVGVLTVAFVLFSIWVIARTIVIWALVSEGRITAFAAIRHSFALTRGAFWKLVAVTVLFLLSTGIVVSALQFTLGSLFLLAGRAAGDQQLGEFLTALLSAVVNGVISSVWAIFAAMLYRRLGASKGI